MRIAGVYASAFFIFYFLNCCVYTRTRNSNESHPGIYFRIGVSPQDKTQIIHIQNALNMKKINQIATINDVALNDKLREWNEENEAFRVQLRIAYAADNSKDENDDDLLSLADFEEAGASVGKTYTCLINFDSLLTDKHTEKEQDRALAKLVEKFKGKKARFSTFDFTISELTDGKEKAINDGTHTYSSLANTYLGSVEDEESEFNKLKNRMLDMIDNDFDFGQADAD